VTGQEFARPYQNLKGCWLMEKVGGDGGGAGQARFPGPDCQARAEKGAWCEAGAAAAGQPVIRQGKAQACAAPLPLPPQVVLAFAKRVVSAMEVGDMAKQPYMVFPLLPLAHVVNVSMPGEVRAAEGLHFQGPGGFGDPCPAPPLFRAPCGAQIAQSPPAPCSMPLFLPAPRSRRSTRPRRTAACGTPPWWTAPVRGRWP
jgi:hypothetical protein